MAKVGAPQLWTDEEREKLSKEMIAFVSQDHVFHFSQWFQHKDKTAAWWYDLCKKYKDLLDTHRKAKTILGGKIVRLAFENGNSWAIQTFIPMYLDDVHGYMEGIKDAALQRTMTHEKYKNELGLASHEEAKAKADDMSISIDLMDEVMKLRKLVEKHGISLDESEYS